MGDLIRGHTYSEGDLVTPDNLHALVENATIKDGVITTSKIADEAITSAKLASNLAITANKISLSNGKLLVGNASNVGAEYSFGEQFELDTSNQKVSIKDGGIGDDQLAAISGLTAGTYNGSFSSGNIVIPYFTVNTKGRITEAGTNSIPLYKKVEYGAGAGENGLPISSAVNLGNPWSSEGGAPGLIIGFVECIADDYGDGDSYQTGSPYYVTGDRLPIWCFRRGEDWQPAFNIVKLANNDIYICPIYKSATFVFTPRNQAGGAAIQITNTNWKIVLYVYRE